MVVFRFEERERPTFVKKFVVLLDVAHAALGQQLQPVLHLFHRIAQGISRYFWFGDDGGEQMRHPFVHAQFQPLGIH